MLCTQGSPKSKPTLIKRIKSASVLSDGGVSCLIGWWLGYFGHWRDGLCLLPNKGTHRRIEITGDFWHESSLSGCAAEILFRKRAPLSVFVLLPHERAPGALLGSEREGVLKFTVRVIKSDRESISIALARTERLGKMPAKDINPMDDVMLSGVIVANKNHRLIFRRSRHVPIVQPQKLVVQHPFGAHRVFRCPVFHETDDLPVTGQTIEKCILQWMVTAILRLLGLGR